MEAVPRLPMINFSLKVSPENVDFSSKLKQLINSVGEDASGFDKEIKELETLRAISCIRVSETVEGVSTIKRYHCQLLFLKSRFKIGSDCPFQFSWRDIYSGSDYSVSDMSHELAATLYNIGALHSKLGVAEERQESDGMKMAVAHFQCAAWAFHTLPDKFPQDPDSDMASEVLAFKSGLCLAQAQECILEKSLLDCRKPGIVTKVCGQVVEYYKQALKQLEMSVAREMTDHMDSLLEIVGNKQSRNWRSYIDFKIMYYSCMSFLHSGMVAEEGGRWGERVAYYEGASNSLIQAGKLAKEWKLELVYKGVTDALVYTNDVVNGKLEISKKENEFIYHEKVPELDSLPSIKGASLVKGIPFDPSDPEVSGPDLFSRIVPLEAHEASSLYSEEQAKLLRVVCGEIEVANDSLVLYLSSMQLEDIPSTTNTSLSLPVDLEECAAGLSVRPKAVSQLQEAMAKLASVSADVEASLMEIQQMLKEEEDKETKFQEVVGTRPKPIMSELERETQKYHQAHSMASESNMTLHKAMQLHVANLKLLARPMQELTASVPSLLQLDQNAQDSLEDMRRIMAKVDEMRNQRAQLEEEFRSGVKKDDITSSLARNTSSDQDAIFKQELAKHDKTVQFIRQNIQAQGNIVRAMGERNAEYADARVKVDELLRRREDMIGSLVASYHAYEDLLNKTTRGLEFYDKLDVNVSKLLARVGGVVKVQEEERNQQMSSSTQRAQDARALSLSLVSGGYRPDFTPGAPPPDTPASAPVPPKAVSGRPKLSDYLAARKSNTAVPPPQPDKSPSESSDFQSGVLSQPPPGIRPQPVGSESDPPHSSSANCPPQPWQSHHQTYLTPGSGIMTTATHPSHHTTLATSMPYQYPGMHYPYQAGYQVPGQQTVVHPTMSGHQVYTSMPGQQAAVLATVPGKHTTMPGQHAGINVTTSIQQLEVNQTIQPSGVHPTMSGQHPTMIGQSHRVHPSFQGMQPGGRSYLPGHQSVVHPTKPEHPSNLHPTMTSQQFPGNQPGVKTSIPGQTSVVNPSMTEHHSGVQQVGVKTSTPGQQVGVPSTIPGQLYGVHSSIPGQQVGVSSSIPGHQIGVPTSILGLQSGGSTSIPGQFYGVQQTIPAQQLGVHQPMSGQQFGYHTMPGQQTGIHTFPSGQHYRLHPTMSGQQSGVHPTMAGQHLEVNATKTGAHPSIPVQQSTFHQIMPGQQIGLNTTMSGQQVEAHIIRPVLHSTVNSTRPGQQFGIHQPIPRQQAGAPPIMPGQQAGVYPNMAGQNAGVYTTSPGQQARAHPTMPGQQAGVYPPMPGQQAGVYPPMPGQQAGVNPTMPGQNARVSSTLAEQQSGVHPTMPGLQAGAHPNMPGQQAGGHLTMSGQMAGLHPTLPGQQAGLHPIMKGQQAGLHPTMPGQKAGVHPTIPGNQIGVLPTMPEQNAGVHSNLTSHQVGVHPTMPGQQSGVNPTMPGEKVVHPTLPGQQSGVHPTMSGQLAGGQPTIISQQVGVYPGQQVGTIQSTLHSSTLHNHQPFTTPVTSSEPIQPVLAKHQSILPTPGSVSANKPAAANLTASNLDLLSGLSLTAASATSTSSPSNTPSQPRPAVPMPGAIPPTIPSPIPSKLPCNTPTLAQPQVSEDERITRLSHEVERLQNLLSNFSSKTLGGQNPLEAKWKELMALVESSQVKRSVSVARCYPGKNRVPDVLPYDQTRVVVMDVKDDYINASRVSIPGEQSCACIITQAPANNSKGEFWSMVWQDGVETMVCLVMDQELGDAVYIPVDKNSIVLDRFTITLQSCKSHSTYIERVINITNTSSRQTRALVHLQMIGWLGPDLPLSPACLLDTAVATLGLKRQQRVTSRPVLVHCMDGGSKSATFLTILWLLDEMESSSGPQVPIGKIWPDVCSKLENLLLQRKGVVRDKMYIRLIYESVLYYMQDILMKQGVLNTGNTTVLGSKKCHSRHPSQDFVGLTVATLKEELKNETELQPPLVTVGEAIDQATSDVGEKNKSTACTPLPPVLLGMSTVMEQDSQVCIESTMSKNIPADLTKLADISLTDEGKSKKITKQDFLNPTGQIGKSDNSDPLSQLDALWSLK